MVASGFSEIAQAAVGCDPSSEPVWLARKLTVWGLFIWELGLDFHTELIPFTVSISYIPINSAEGPYDDCCLLLQRSLRTVAIGDENQDIYQKNQGIGRHAPCEETAGEAVVIHG